MGLSVTITRDGLFEDALIKPQELSSRVKRIPFIVNIVWTLLKKKDEPVDPNPWKATTIEWTATTSPPLGHGNFEKEPVVYRGPYEYSVPDEKEDYTPQTKK